MTCGFNVARWKLYVCRLSSGEVAFALFLMSWAYGDTWSHIGPVSLRLVFLCCSIFWLIASLINSRIQYTSASAHQLLIFFLFFAYAFMSLFWSPPGGVGIERTGNVLGLCIPSFILGTAVIQTRESILRFQAGLIVGLMVGVIHIYVQARAPSVSFIATVLDTDGYQGLNRMLGMGGIALCIALAYQFDTLWQIILALIVLIAAVGEMLVLGGLTGLLAFLGCIGLFSLRFVDFDGKHLLKLTPRTVVLLGLVLLLIGSAVVLSSASVDDIAKMPRAISRIVAKLKWGGEAGTQNLIAKNGRFDIWTEAIKIWSMHPFLGSGIGSWSISAGVASLTGFYAHNLVLEILGELGILGLALFLTPVMILVANVASSWRRINPSSRDLTVIFAIFCLIHAMIIGNLADYWTFAGIGMLFIGDLYRTGPTNPPDLVTARR